MLRPVYNLRIPRAQQILGEERVVHTAEHVASAMFHALGVPRTLEIPRAFLTSCELCQVDSPSYAVIHPFASSLDKTWPAARFVEAARLLATRGIEPVILASANDNLAPFQGLRSFAGRPLAQVKALIRDAAYFLGNDSGPAHIAAAFNIPLTVLFGPSNPAIWGPWRATRARVLTAASMEAIEFHEVAATIMELC
jgi:ADP-heptose:LPS heptosyltransferase